MRKNTGIKIMNFADVFHVLGTMLSVVGGVFFMSTNTFLLIITIALGCLSVYVTYILLFGFGELICDTAENREINEKILNILELQYRQIECGQPVLDEKSTERQI